MARQIWIEWPRSNVAEAQAHTDRSIDIICTPYRETKICLLLFLVPMHRSLSFPSSKLFTACPPASREMRAERGSKKVKKKQVFRRAVGNSFLYQKTNKFDFQKYGGKDVGYVQMRNGESFFFLVCVCIFLFEGGQIEFG